MKIKETGETATDVKPARKGRATKGATKGEDEEVVKREEDDEVNDKPMKKGRGKAVRKEENDEVDLGRKNIKLAKNARAKRAAKKEESPCEGVKEEENEGVAVDVKPAKKAGGQKATKKEEAEETTGMKREDCDDVDIKFFSKKEENGDSIDVKEEDKYGDSVEDNRRDMPNDPLQRISDAFCDKDGPLVSDYNEMVSAGEVTDKDWTGFLQKKFQVMLGSGEVGDGDWNGFLRKMHEREVAAAETRDVVPKKSRKAKKA